MKKRITFFVVSACAHSVLAAVLSLAPADWKSDSGVRIGQENGALALTATQRNKVGSAETWADICGNYMCFANDDCIELDGGQQNVRSFDNRYEGATCGVSIHSLEKGDEVLAILDRLPPPTT